MTTTTLTGTAADRRLNFWGRLTLGLGLMISLSAPIYLFTVDGLWPGWPALITSAVGIATIFAVNWIVEPVTYFPMLGVAGSYQAWLVGNISNKLLPASITAQAALGAKPGTRRAELVSIAAISGAVIVHVLSLVILVAIGGTFIIAVLPAFVTEAFAYILPAVLGPVFVQLALTLKAPKVVLVGLGLAVIMVFGVVPAVPALAPVALPIVVVATVAIAVGFARRAAGKENA